MDERLLRAYDRELRFVRETGAEFASAYPKIAGRLGLSGTECADPYVERLLEGFAFLAARVRLKLDAEYPRFTDALLDAVCPHYLTPLPSMGVAHLRIDENEPGLAEGVTLPRGSPLRGQLGRGDQTACEFRTAQPVRLLALRVEDAGYHTRDLRAIGAPTTAKERAVLRLRFRTTAGVPLKALALDEPLRLFLAGPDEKPFVIYRQIFSRALRVLARPEGAQRWHEVPAAAGIAQPGFEPDEALLPDSPRSFDGYRLLREYFAFPRRFLFADLANLAPAAEESPATALDVLITLSETEPDLEDGVSASDFLLHCVPVVNAFPKRLDRVPVSDTAEEHHVVADRTRVEDFEVHTITSVLGYSDPSRPDVVFRPLYEATAFAPRDGAYYALHRRPRLRSVREDRGGLPGKRRSSYTGSEVFLSLVDQRNAPFRRDLRHLGVEAICTNRDLPIHMPVGIGRTDLLSEIGSGVGEIRFVAGPTPPRPSDAHGPGAWRILSHLRLNYLSLADSDPEQGAAALRSLIALYADPARPETLRQAEGLRSIRAEPIVRRVPGPGPITFGRGMSVDLEVDHAAFEGIGPFLLGCVLDRFLGAYVSINSFTQLRLASQKGEIARWSPRMGLRRPL